MVLESRQDTDRLDTAIGETEKNLRVQTNKNEAKTVPLPLTQIMAQTRSGNAYELGSGSIVPVPSLKKGSEESHVCMIRQNHFIFNANQTGVTAFGIGQKKSHQGFIFTWRFSLHQHQWYRLP